MRTRQIPLILYPLMVLLLAVAAAGQNRITTPKEQFGFNLGDDYQLTNYVQLTEYWKKLDQQSDRMKLVEIGKTAEGRTILMAIITSPENHKKLDRYKEISRRLALAEGLTDEQARALAAEGKQCASQKTSDSWLLTSTWTDTTWLPSGICGSLSQRNAPLRVCTGFTRSTSVTTTIATFTWLLRPRPKQSTASSTTNGFHRS